jgi:putative phosphoribosyl transferase
MNPRETLVRVKPMQIFSDRAEAGRVLAEALVDFAGRQDVVVLALPRGGVPVGYEVAKGLRAPLDVFVVRKLGMPGQEELAMGAIATGGVRVLNQDLLAQIKVPPSLIDEVAAVELEELERRERKYRNGRPPLQLRDRTVILVDDGLATGSTMRAAVAAVKQQEPRTIVVAVPVGARETCNSLSRDLKTTTVCAMTPEALRAVGLWYRNFSQTTDEEVRSLLDQAQQIKAAA